MSISALMPNSDESNQARCEESAFTGFLQLDRLGDIAKLNQVVALALRAGAYHFPARTRNIFPLVIILEETRLFDSIPDGHCTQLPPTVNSGVHPATTCRRPSLLVSLEGDLAHRGISSAFPSAAPSPEIRI